MHGPATGPGYQSRSGLREASSKRGRSTQINGTAAGREESQSTVLGLGAS